MGVFNTLKNSIISPLFFDGPFEKFASLRQFGLLGEASSRTVILGDFSSEEKYQGLENSLALLKSNDIGLFAATENNLRRGKSSFRPILEKNGAFISGVMIFPESIGCKFFTEQTEGFRSNYQEQVPFEDGLYLLVVQKVRCEQEFVAEITSLDNIEDVTNRYFKHLARNNSAKDSG